MDLKIEDITFNRNEKGELIPEKVVLETLEDKPTVTLVPLTRGKLQEIYSKYNTGNQEERISADNEVLLCGLIEPKISVEKIKDLKPRFANAISVAILSISLNIPQTEVLKKTETALLEKEFELKKK